jgi:hypothetical protein
MLIYILLNDLYVIGFLNIVFSVFLTRLCSWTRKWCKRCEFMLSINYFWQTVEKGIYLCWMFITKCLLNKSIKKKWFHMCRLGFTMSIWNIHEISYRNSMWILNEIDSATMFCNNSVSYIYFSCSDFSLIHTAR